MTVQAYNQQGSTLPNAQVILQTPQGTLKGTTNSNGIATFEDVQGTSTVTIAGNTYIGASQSVAIDASKTFSGVIIDGTGMTAYSLKRVHGVNSIRKNPILFDVQSTWPNYNIPLDASALGTTDSAKVWEYYNWYNSSMGKTVFIPGKVEAGVGRGITLLIGASYGTINSPENGYAKNSTSVLESDLSKWACLHEDWHALIKVGDFSPGQNSGYSPSNYSDYGVDIQTKDVVYKDLGYLSQYFRQTGINEFDMYGFDDAITTVTNNAPSQSTPISPANNDATIDAKTATTFTWTGVTDPDGDWVRYNIEFESISDTTSKITIKNINDTLLILPAGTLKDNTTYTWTITATDNDKETPSNASTFKTIEHITPNSPPTTFTAIHQ